MWEAMTNDVRSSIGGPASQINQRRTTEALKHAHNLQPHHKQLRE
ncbi:21193_t:CDS:1, partial [Dentiscutata erythropus]